MTTLLRILRLYSLALWAGGEVFFVLVAGIAFTVLPDAHSAGLVVRSALIDLHRMGIGAGVIYLLATLGLLAMRRDAHRARAVEVALVGVMLALTLYSQMSVIPRMESDRLSIGGDVTAVSKDNPARQDFDRLHSLSVNLEGAVLLCSFVLIALAPVHDRRTQTSASN
ncbi:MAG TPA: DUF4149 domain-containing protein [Acidobacteriaceae bacterium]|nr:DUF4149 domain-containing protein [Acidobacteriaceae bacterium]